MKQHINEDIPVNGRFEGKIRRVWRYQRGNQNP